MKNSRRSLISRTLEHLRNLWRRRKRAGRVTADRSQLRLEMLEPRLALTISSPLPSPTAHIHPVLSLFVDGNQVVIPSGVGLGTQEFNPHTHDSTGTLHIGEGMPAGLGTTIRNVTLKDFFDVWRTSNVGQGTNNPNAILDTVTNDGTPAIRFLDKTVDSSHVLRMYVKETSDAAPELEYDSSAATNDIAHPEDYVPRDGDQVIIRYVSSNATANGPSFALLANQTVLVGAPTWLALDGFEADSGPITYDVQVGNSNLLTATIPQGDRSLVMDVAGFGKMTFELFDGLAPRVTQRIVDLANSGFYNLSQSNQITFHRVVPNFVIQAGDPTGTGSGGSLLGDFDDQFSVDLQHTSSGILSMAKSFDDTNDSQFFITDTATRFLDFNHSIFGRLTEGEAIRDAINNVPVHTDQNDLATFNHPITPVVINSISVVQHDPQNAALELKAKPGATGTTTVTVTAHDAQNHTFSQTFQVTFANDTSNGAPFLQDIAPVHVTSGQPIQIQLASTDIEGDPVVYSALKPAGETTAYTLNVNSSTGLVTVTPPAGFVGTFNVLAQVKSVTPNSTGAGTDFDEQKIAVTVSAAGPSGVDLKDDSDTGISNTDNITNAATLNFLVNGVTSGATVKLFKDTTLLAQGTANGTSITLTVANPGTLLGQGISHIKATQTPAGGQESAASPVLDVTFDNVIADFNSVGPSSALDGFDINYNAQNPDEGSAGFSYSLTTPPAGATINSSTGVLTWIPTAAQIGPQSFAIVATDTAGNTRTQSLNVTVNDSKVDLTFTITKPDGTPLTSLSLNQDFVLHVFTRDLRTPARGVFAGYLDVLWDSTKAIVTAADLAHPLTYGTNYQSGQAGDASTPGLINEGGAFAGFNELGAGNRELFSVPMRATASGPLVFTAEPADDQSQHRVLVYNAPTDSSGVQVPPQEVHYSALSITVAATFNAVGDAVNALEDSQNNSFNPLANDTNIGNATNTLTITAVSTPDHGGTVVIAPNGKTISYTPSHNFAGTETFTYAAKNQNNESNSATITVTVADVNDPPTAVGDTVNVTRNSSGNAANVLANDLITPDANETLRVTAVGATSHGTVSIGANGANVLYTPSANFSGQDSFTYTISDRTSGGLTSQATVTVNVSGLAANNDATTVVEDSSNNAISPLTNDTLDTQFGGTLSISGVGTPNHGGTVTITGGGTGLNYTPSANFQGTETLTYTLSDGLGHTATGTVTATVTNTNDPPTAVNDTLTGFKNTGLTFDVLANDTSAPDPAENLVIDSITQPANGTLSIVENGKKVSFVPSSNFTGTTSFTYVVSDPSNATSNTATATINVQEFVPSVLSGFVYFDVDNDGVKDAAELPISGVTVTLTGTTTTTATVSLTVKTKNDGSYKFENLAPGTYTVKETQPAFTIDGKDTAGSQGGSASTNDQIVVTNMPQGTTGTSNNFGERGRVVSTMSIRDLFSSVSRDYALTALDTSGGELWHSMSNPAWQGYTDGTFSLQNNTQLKLQTTNPQSQPVATTISLPSTKVGVLGQTSGNSLYRLNGGPASFTFTNTTPPNQAPAAVNDSFTATEDVQRTVTSNGVLSNDSDPDGNSLTASLASQAIHGTVTLGSNGLFTYAPSANFVGTDSFTYRASDATTSSGVATVTITVIPVNDVPTATGDSFAATEDTPRTVAASGVLSNDSDLDGTTPTAVNVTQPAHGTVTLGTDGSFTYTPSQNFNGTDSFTYQASDGTTQSSVATVTLNVVAVNDAPIAGNDAFTASQDVPRTVSAAGVLNNDSDPDGTTPTPVNATQPANGTVTLGSDGSFTYTPSAGFSGQDSFTYQASDGTTTSDFATVTINVTPTNQSPVAVNDEYETDEDITLIKNADDGVRHNDHDPEGATLTVSLVTGPTNGSLTLAPDGSFTYIPSSDFHGTDGFSYLVSDGLSESQVAAVTIIVHPVNDAPTVVGDAFTTNEDVPLTVTADGVLDNDADVDGTSPILADVTQPVHGTVTFGGDGSFTYTPSLNFNGQDSFTYQATDGTATSAVATVTITVHAVNDTPEAVGDTFAGTEDAPLTVAAPGVLANDNDVNVDSDTLLAVAVSQPAHGTVTASGTGGFTYTPEADFNGSDSFTYRTSDGFATSGVATVTINVAPASDAPIAHNDQYSTPVNQALIVGLPGVLENDEDPDEDPLTASIAVGPTHGSLAMGTNGSFIYTPAAFFHGIDSFSYVAKDNALASTATVSIAVNSAPTAIADDFETSEDIPLTIAASGVLANDSDPNSDGIFAELISGTQHGSVLLGTDGSFTYTPTPEFNGTDGFSYWAKDVFGTPSLPVTVVLTVHAINDAPVAVGDAYTTDEDQPLDKDFAAGVLHNDTDIETPNTLTAILGQGPVHGDLSFSEDGSFHYTPTANFHGTDSFTYHNSDGVSDSTDATVTITVSSVNDDPEAFGDAFDTNEDATLTVAAPGLLINDQDVDDDGLTASLAVGPGHGSLAVYADGSFTYTPSAGFDGTDSFSYTVNDGTANSAPAIVTLTVHPVNHAPIAVDDNYMATQDASLDVTVTAGVLSNDSDPDGPVTLHATVVDAPHHGSLTLGDDGHFLYTPTAGYSGPDSFTYDVSDGALHDQALVSITVQPTGGGEGESSDSDAALLAYLMSGDANHENTFALLTGAADNWAAAVDQTLTELYA